MKKVQAQLAEKGELLCCVESVAAELHFRQTGYYTVCMTKIFVLNRIVVVKGARAAKDI